MRLFNLLFFAAECFAYCKPTPGSASWPSDHQWRSLNASISGRLLKGKAPGAVCFQDQPEYNNNSVACQDIIVQWSNSSFHRDSPFTTDYNDDTCSPVLVQYNTSCSTSGYPAYVVVAEEISDVQAGVRFAAQTGVRLTVKGTGHDLIGRSSGPGSLSIWTRKLQGIEFGDDGTAKIMAGMVVKEILLAAGEKNLTIVTGSDPTVGIGGWLAGAGHSPISAKYGMGADQAVEMEVVTALGEYLIINEHQHSDLFWAMRGGGASTYAVMISVTVKTYPNIAVSIISRNYTTTAESDDFWSMATSFHNEIPNLSDSGVMGFYYTMADKSLVIPDSPSVGTIIATFLVPEKSVSEGDALLLPMEQKFKSTNISRAGVTAPSYSLAWSQNPPEGVGSNSRLGSRLLDRKAHLSPNLTTALKAAMPQKNVRVLIGNLVPGRKPVDNAVLPAWRTAYNHLIIAKSWGPPSDKDVSVADLKVHTQALKDLAPEMGAYINESDPSDEDWQQDYFGSHYPRLLAIKKKYDPQGVFWCKPCVGNEMWTVTGGDGIGQDFGRLCRV